MDSFDQHVPLRLSERQPREENSLSSCDVEMTFPTPFTMPEEESAALRKVHYDLTKIILKTK